jgi:hypothetical protein
MRRLFLGLALAAAFLTAGPAEATTTGDVHAGSFYDTSYVSLAGDPGTHDVLSGWVQASRNYPARDEVNLRVTTGNIIGAEGDWCIQIAYDWTSVNDHYDPRIVRNCDSNSTRRTPLDYVEPLCGIAPCDMTMHSVQIATYRRSDGALGTKECWIPPGVDRTCAGWNPADSTNCARIWGRKPDGTNWYQSGGDPQDCNN